MSRVENRKKDSKLTFIIMAIILLVVAAGITVYMMKNKNDDKNTVAQVEEKTETSQTPEPEKQVEIYSGTDRPIAVMIDNNVNAWPQAGLNKAYMVYEIIVEGGETRLMALFKNVNVEKIGPVRSSRHYFLDYVMENDALYTHYGWSFLAEADIPKLNINNINGLVEGSGTFWRDNTRSAPHNALISTDNILKAAERKGYRTTSDQRSVLNYTTDEVVLNDGIDATYVKIPYSTYKVVEYKYDEENKRYTRYSKGQKQTDWNTGEDVTTKNVIITFARNYNSSANAKLQELQNIGSLKGYYMTNGKAIEITCEKTSRSGKTVYKDLEGNEIKVNDGNTFVQICPIDANVTFSQN